VLDEKVKREGGGKGERGGGARFRNHKKNSLSPSGEEGRGEGDARCRERYAENIVPAAREKFDSTRDSGPLSPCLSPEGERVKGGS
jgi:hypothetical protein